MSKDKDLKEQTTYDNFLNTESSNAEPDKAPSLSDMMGSEPRIKKEWEDHWTGMPEFEQNANSPYKKITMSFQTQADYEEFAKLINQRLTEKTKSVWYPQQNRTANSLLRWFNEDEETNE